MLDVSPRPETRKPDARAARDAFAPLRILMSSYRSHPHSGGQGVFMKHLTRALVDLGHSVDVVSGPPYPDLDPRVKLHGLPSLDLYATKYPVRGLARIRAPEDLYEYFAHLTGRFGEPYSFGVRFAKWIRAHAGDYDVLHDNQTLSWGILEAEKCGLPTVAQLHHPITVDRNLALKAAAGWRPRQWGLRQLIRRWHGFLPMQMRVAQRIPHLVTISQSSRRDFAREFGLDTDRIACVPCGIDLATFRPMPDIPRAENKLICTSSADVALKGLIYLIEAMAILAPSHPDLRLTVVGKLKEGPTQRRLAKLGLADRIEFVSGISDEALVRHYNSATIAVAPSLYEGFGLPAGEAMACGAPVVSTTGGSLPEVVGEAGVLVPVKDPKALADAIAALLADPARRALLSAAGRARVAEKFSWRRAAQDTVAAYRTAIAGC